MLVGDGYRRIPSEWGLSGEKLEEQDACRIQIRACIHRLTLCLLGGKVLSGANDCVRLSHRRLRIGDCAGNTEVHDLDFALGGQHDVAGLDVAVDQASGMRVLQRREYAGNNVNDLGNGEGARVVGEQVLQRTPINVFHDDVRN